MNVLVERVIGLAEKRDDYETRTYTISARPDHLDKIEELFRWMNMTRGGHSGSAEIYIDGDGAARVKVERQNGELVKVDDDAFEHRDSSPEFKVGLD